MIFLLHFITHWTEYIIFIASKDKFFKTGKIGMRPTLLTRLDVYKKAILCYETNKLHA